MSQLLGSSFSNAFLKDLKQCEKSVTIISPYVTQGAVESLVKLIPPVRQCKLITLPPGEEYLFGSVEIDALKLLEKYNFQIYVLPNLHSKIYLLDDNRAYIGSANLTSKGWNEKNKGNVEDMVKVEIKKLELTHIQKLYITPSSLLDLNGKWVKHLDAGKKLLEEYKSIKQKIKNWDTTIKEEFENNTRSVGTRVYFSDYREQQHIYPHNFKFPITKNAGNLAIKEKLDFLFKLGGSSENPDARIFVPFSIMKKVLVKDHLGKDSWTIHINFDKNGNPFLRSFNKKKIEEKYPLEKKNFSGKLKKPPNNSWE